VTVVFGLPGDGINGLMESLRKRADCIQFVQVRHEESAAFAACGYAKFTGRLGVCLATSGPGGLHEFNGLYDAKMDGQPVLAITGHHFHDLIDTFAQQDVNLDRVFADACVYSTRVMGPSHVANVTELACARRRAGTASRTSTSPSISRMPTPATGFARSATSKIIRPTSSHGALLCPPPKTCDVPQTF
jgi:thiamine pyrophosphate-dependent acetolactate synthase large subunit-like protein